MMQLPKLPSHPKLEWAKIQEAIQAKPLLQNLQTIVSQAKESHPELAEKLITFSAAEIDLIQDACANISESEDIHYALAVRYASLKAIWTLSNIQINYEVAAGKVPEAILPYKAAVYSAILEAIEPLVTRDAINNITKVLAEPMNSHPTDRKSA